MILIFTRLWTKATGQMLYFLPFGVFAFGTHCVFGRQLRIVFEIIVYSTSNKLEFQVQLSFRIIVDLFKYMTVLLKRFNMPQW